MLFRSKIWQSPKGWPLESLPPNTNITSTSTVSTNGCSNINHNYEAVILYSPSVFFRILAECLHLGCGDLDVSCLVHSKSLNFSNEDINIVDYTVANLLMENEY